MSHASTPRRRGHQARLAKIPFQSPQGDVIASCLGEPPTLPSTPDFTLFPQTPESTTFNPPDANYQHAHQAGYGWPSHGTNLFASPNATQRRLSFHGSVDSGFHSSATPSTLLCPDASPELYSPDQRCLQPHFVSTPHVVLEAVKDENTSSPAAQSGLDDQNGTFRREPKHDGQSNRCDLCGIRFSWNKDLSRHKRDHCKNVSQTALRQRQERAYFCRCGKRFPRWYNIQNHQEKCRLKNEQDPTRAFRCPCRTPFKDFVSLQREYRRQHSCKRGRPRRENAKTTEDEGSVFATKSDTVQAEANSRSHTCTRTLAQRVPNVQNPQMIESSNILPSQGQMGDLQHHDSNISYSGSIHNWTNFPTTFVDPFHHSRLDPSIMNAQSSDPLIEPDYSGSFAGSFGAFPQNAEIEHIWRRSYYPLPLRCPRFDIPAKPLEAIDFNAISDETIDFVASQHGYMQYCPSSTLMCS